MNIEQIHPAIAAQLLEGGKTNELHRIVYIAKVCPEGDISRMALVKVKQYVMAADAKEALQLFESNAPAEINDLSVLEVKWIAAITTADGIEEDSIIEVKKLGPRAVEH